MFTISSTNFRRLLPLGPQGWLIRTPGYTPHEVRLLLREGQNTPRGRAVSRCAARVSDWLPPLPDVERCPCHYRERLPRIVYWYARGESVEEISRRICAIGTPWGVERSLQVACRRIAQRLNDYPDEYGARV